MAKNATMGSVFVEMLSGSNNMNNRFMAPYIDEIIKDEHCSEMFDILVINALGHKCPICESTIDSAISYIISRCHKQIEESNYESAEKHQERQQCTDFYTQAAQNLKQHFATTGLLHKC